MIDCETDTRNRARPARYIIEIFGEAIRDLNAKCCYSIAIFHFQSQLILLSDIISKTAMKNVLKIRSD